MPPAQDASRVDELVRLITEFKAQHGFAPTRSELAERMSLKSNSTVQHYIEQAIAKGRVSQVPGSSRTLQVVA